MWATFRGTLGSSKQRICNSTSRCPGTSTTPSKSARILSGNNTAYVKARDLAAAPLLRQAGLVSVGSVSETVESTPEVVEKPLESISSEESTIKVAANSKVQSIAGKLAHSARMGNVPEVVCMGAKSTNITVKAIAISRRYLENENLDVSFKSSYKKVDGDKENDKDLKGFVFKIVPSQANTASPPTADTVEMHIRSNSDPRKSAGALAARVREMRPVFLIAIGAGAVRAAVLTLEKARQYLRRDRKEIRAQPEFVLVKREEGDLNAIKFNVVVEDL